MITVKINGEQLQTDARTLAELLQQLNLEGRRCATMVNGAIIKRAAREAQELQAGDDIEIISMVGGG